MTATFDDRDHPRGRGGQFVSAGGNRVSADQRDRLRDAAGASSQEPVARLVAEIEERGLGAEALDDLVFDLKGAEATAINDAGLHAQVAYLRLDPRSRSWRESDLEDQVNDAKAAEACALSEAGVAAKVSYVCESLGETEAEAEIRKAS